MLGRHLTLDFYKCEQESLNKPDFIYKILDELPNVIGMNKLTKPSVIVYEGDPETFDKGGVSGFVIIAESHISVHTFAEQRFASVDIFSCKDFNMDKAVNYLLDKLVAEKVEKNVIIRGTEFPKDVKKVNVIVNTQRFKISKTY